MKERLRSVMKPEDQTLLDEYAEDCDFFFTFMDLSEQSVLKISRLLQKDKCVCDGGKEITLPIN